MKTNQDFLNRFLAALLGIVSLLLVTLSAGTARAQDVTAAWNQDANGNWSEGANWSGGNAATGATGVAYFTNTVSAIKTVTLDIYPWTINSLVINNTGTFAWNIGGVGTAFDLAGTTPTITVNGPVSVGNQFYATLSGSAGFTKAGTGQSLHGPNTADTFTGGLNVNEGQLTLTWGNFAANVNLIDPANALAMNGGVLAMQAKSSVAGQSQAFNGTTLNMGHSTIDLNASSTTTFPVTLGPVTRNAGATLNIALTHSGTGNKRLSSTSWATGQPILDSGVAYATLYTGGSTATPPSGGDNWAQFSGVYPLAATYTASTATTLSGNANVATGVDTTLSADTSITSLRFGLAEARTITINSGNTLSVGGILIASTVGANPSTITGGTLRSAATVANKDLVIINNDASSSLTIGSVIADAAAGAAGLTKSGVGALVLIGANTYAGPTIVNAGSMTVGNDLALQNSALDTTGSGTFVLTGLITPTLGGLRGTKDLSLPATVTALTLNPSAGFINTYSGDLSGFAAGMTLTKTGQGTQVLSGVNAYTGTTTLSAGTLGMGAADNLGTAAANLVFDGGTLQINGMSLSSLSGLGHAVSLTAGKTVGLDIAQAGQTFTADMVLNQTTGGLTKQGAGTLVLNQANTYSGPTIIGGGTLTLSAGASIANTPSLDLAGGATLDVTAVSFTLSGSRTLSGSGTVNGNVSASSGSQILPGGTGSVGNLSFNNNLTLAGGGTVVVDFNTTTNDVLVIGGNLSPSGTTFINLATPPTEVGTYTLMQVNGSLGGTASNFTLTGVPSPTRFTFNIVYDTVSSSKRVLLQVGGSGANLVWKGGLNGNAWDITTTANWLNGVSSDLYFNGDAVRFTDAGAANQPVLSTTVLPAAVTFDAASAYTLSGNGAIAGDIGLTKTNSGVLTLAITNTYTGVTYLGGGTVSMGTLLNGGVASPIGAATSAAANLVYDGGTLRYTGASTGWDRAATLNAGGGGLEINNSAATVTLSGVIQGALGGGFVKSGPGALVLTVNETYDGPTTINGGTLTIGSTGLLGGGTYSANILNNGALLYSGTAAQTFSGSIAGTGTLTLSSGNTNTLAGANNFSGGTTLLGTGALALTHSLALGTGPLALQSTQTGASPTVLLAGGITVTNPIIINPTTGREAIWSISGNNTLSGPITITGAGANAIYLENAGESGSLFAVSNSISGPSSTGAFSLRGPAGNFGLISGQITLNSIFQIIGSANWTVASSGNSWTQTRISQGTGGFVLGANDALATGVKVLWDSDTSGALDLAGYNQTVAGLDCASTTTTPPTVGNSSTSSDSLLKINGGGNTFIGSLVDVIGSGSKTLSVELLSGIQTLAGNSTYTGPTTISGGTLQVKDTGSLAAGSAVTVKTNATLAGAGGVYGPVTVNSGGSLTAGIAGAGNLTVGSLTLGAASGDTQTINVTPANVIYVQGGLTNTGTTTIKVTSASGYSSGTFSLITYTGDTITNGFVLGSLPVRVEGYLQYNTSSIDLVITSAVNDSPKWTGATNGVWNTTTTNWVLINYGTPTTYVDDTPGDAVLFDDTLTDNPAITLNTTVSPGGMTFNNVTTAYSVTGSGSIAGTGGFTKTGTNIVTLSTSNSFTGAVSVGGRVVIKKSTALGIGSKTITVKSAVAGSDSTHAELHLDGSGGAIILPAEYAFSTYGDVNFLGNIVNDAGDNIINSSLNMASGGGVTYIYVQGGSLTFNGNVTCNNGSSGKTLTLRGGGTNVLNGSLQDGTQQARLGVLGGQWTLTNTNPYTGVTTVGTNATLVVNGSIGVGAVTVQNGGTLSGNGTLLGATTVQLGGTLAPGTSVGTLTVSNSLTLQGTAVMEIARNAAVLTKDQVAGVSSLTYGGSLIVTNIGSSPLQVGDSFKLFAATTYASAFTNVVYPAGYTFTDNLAVNGTITVLTAPVTTPPNFPPGGISFLPDGNISLTATGAVGATYTLWASTDVVARPITTTWSNLSSGTITVSPFTIDDLDATNHPQRFYLFSAP
jgi:fibronectin-binding autotransporter adhesin